MKISAISRRFSAASTGGRQLQVDWKVKLSPLRDFAKALGPYLDNKLSMTRGEISTFILSVFTNQQDSRNLESSHKEVSS